VDTKTRAGVEAAYTHPPEIYSITAAATGALIPATHARRELDEVLGESDGTPAQRFNLRNAPVLKPIDGVETLEVREPESEQWRQWTLKEAFNESGEEDTHYMLDLTTGEIELGPSIRGRDPGGRLWIPYGAVPPKGSTLRFTRYRHGGGRAGNVAAQALSMLKSAIPGVASVTNPLPARGGVDGETRGVARRWRCTRATAR
jgi:predicted phage baseplate assembly protein